jgi:uncharacterized membrane protein
VARRQGRDHRAKGVAALWIGAGTMHFVIPRQYQAIVPSWLPAHRELVAASGVAEIAGGLAALHPGSRTAARWWLLATLVAVYPANVDMCLNAERYPKIPAWPLWARLPVQGLFAWFTIWGTGAPEHDDQRPQTSAVAIVRRLAHHRDDLFHGRRSAGYSWPLLRGGRPTW